MSVGRMSSEHESNICSMGGFRCCQTRSFRGARGLTASDGIWLQQDSLNVRLFVGQGQPKVFHTNLHGCSWL